jgi:purine-binding chemotaxis protein CheW
MVEEKVSKSNLDINVLNNQFIHASAENQYVTFQIGEEYYGIGVSNVQEIIRYKKPTKVFNANPIITGVINFRGDVIPIINMHLKFCLPTAEYDTYTVIIVVEVNTRTMGLIVDRVSDIITVSKEEIKLVNNEFAEDMKTEYLSGLINKDDRVIMLLEPSQLIKYLEVLEEKEE